MSSHASTQDKSPDPSQALNIERKKTKVLKQALKQERKSLADLQQQFEQSKEQIAELNTQLQDKVSFGMSLCAKPRHIQSQIIGCWSEFLSRMLTCNLSTLGKTLL